MFSVVVRSQRRNSGLGFCRDTTTVATTDCHVQPAAGTRGVVEVPAIARDDHGMVAFQALRFVNGAEAPLRGHGPSE
jgi:hypothetical protein